MAILHRLGFDPRRTSQRQVQPVVPCNQVKAYTTKTGKMVAPSHHTKANMTKLDNYGTEGNVSVFTGKAGKKKGF